MKKILNKLIRNEEGQVFVLALILLLVGGLILAPLLSYMSSGLIVGQVHEENMKQFYAADAGIEYGIWDVMNDDLGVPDFELNGSNVVVTTEEIDIATLTEDQKQTFNLNDGDRLWTILSTAINTNGSTTVESYFAIAFRLADEDTYIDYGGSGNIEGGNVIVEDGDIVTGNIMGNAQVWGEGDLTVTGNFEGDAIVNIVGDVNLNGAGNILGDTTIRVFGNMTINGNIEGNAEVYVSGNLTILGNITGTSLVGVGGNLDVDGNIYRDVYVGGTITVGGSMTGANLGLDNIPFDTACPLGIAVPVTLTFEIQ